MVGFPVVVSGFDIAEINERRDAENLPLMEGASLGVEQHVIDHIVGMKFLPIPGGVFNSKTQKVSLKPRRLLRVAFGADPLQ